MRSACLLQIQKAMGDIRMAQLQLDALLTLISPAVPHVLHAFCLQKWLSWC